MKHWERGLINSFCLCSSSVLCCQNSLAIFNSQFILFEMWPFFLLTFFLTAPTFFSFSVLSHFLFISFFSFDLDNIRPSFSHFVSLSLFLCKWILWVFYVRAVFLRTHSFHLEVDPTLLDALLLPSLLKYRSLKAIRSFSFGFSDRLFRVLWYVSNLFPLIWSVRITANKDSH